MTVTTDQLSYFVTEVNDSMDSLFSYQFKGQFPSPDICGHGFVVDAFSREFGAASATTVAAFAVVVVAVVVVDERLSELESRSHDGKAKVLKYS